MDLLDQLRSLRAAEASATMPQATMMDAAGGVLGLAGMGGTLPIGSMLVGMMALLEGASDADLIAAYQRTDGEPGNPEADALAAEMERRGLGR